ncbi:type I restriction enzyme HsdR N-terminal domain-containing protein [Fulvivirga lutea]|uniref:Type I restriction enzyme HsdR N-terminal domain-containing protein n=1 Tax=Fulvivirga lutea TaxID=2810512 RepID=A0A975A098_9BACT|nr:type I restriction enzyme HsdR N-terminal domain-containing protein [Fulvivirga lutea]QSE97164.1 type I restriction enzyme HsdR N-terminal domain-containing protein [Fulvivirga lutea]
MIKLNLPDFDCKLRKNAGKTEVFDIIRKKYVVLQPEEWVRQGFIHFLINQSDFPKSLIKIESGLKYNRLDKRSDIQVLNSDGTTFMIVECKSFKVKLDQKALDQLTMYNKTINARYIVLTNGINHFCCEMMNQSKYEFRDQIPVYSKNA